MKCSISISISRVTKTKPTLEQQHHNFSSTYKATMNSLGRFPDAPTLASGIGATCSLFRLAIDLIQATYDENRQNFNRLLKYDDATGIQVSSATTKQQGLKSTTTHEHRKLEKYKSTHPCASSSYGTFPDNQAQVLFPMEVASDGEEGNTSPLQPLLRKSGADNDSSIETESAEESEYGRKKNIFHRVTKVVSLDMEGANLASINKYSTLIHSVIAAYLLLDLYLSSIFHPANKYNTVLILCTSFSSFACIVLNWRDSKRERFSFVQRVFYLSSSLSLLYGGLYAIFRFELYNYVDFSTVSSTSPWDWMALLFLSLYMFICLWECKQCPFPIHHNRDGKSVLSRKAIFTMLRPYFWPDAKKVAGIDDHATLNRIRAILTWVCVALAKACLLIAPVLIGRASTALTRTDYGESIKYLAIYCAAIFASNFLKEAQGLLYLKVSQTAFIQLSEIVFYHLHSLSLDWHLNRKLGEGKYNVRALTHHIGDYVFYFVFSSISEFSFFKISFILVIRSMDRGINACDSIMKFLFLRLVPTMTECTMIIIIFASYFQHFALSVTVFFFVFFYAVLTIVLTLWRRRFRRKLSKRDNDWHSRCTDSLMNFETVKYFTAESYEVEQFSDTVKRYQRENVAVEASVSLLNVLQSLLFQACLFTSLSLTAIDIKGKIDCCVQNGCDALNSTCCATISNCPGMSVGDFVAVLAYVMQLFVPLNFLGGIYQAIIMATVDLSNLLDILALMPEVRDAQDAMPLSTLNTKDPEVAVEFDHVYFHYPAQDSSQGVKNVSFKMKKGTVTAIVGHTGSGKTTLSRLLFRFYDVNRGAIKVNGMDIRTVTQQSLREHIGVVPQAAELFNDSIRNNILYGKQSATDEELKRVIKAAQLDRFIDSLPNGWDTLVGDRGLRLSGGEKQRTAIARCLLKDPPFLILDEATSSLDTLTESSVQEALDQLRNDRTCLVVAHRLGTIRGADNIIVLDNGEIIEEGTHQDLLAKNGVYAEMWYKQLPTEDQEMDLGIQPSIIV